MTFAHWLYVLGVIAVVLTMILRRNVVIPCVIFTFFIGWVYLGSFIGGIQALFNSNIIAAQELFSVFYIIAVMVAMLKSISVTGADKILVKPLTKLMVSPLVSYIVLCISTIIISLFFWPTPAVPKAPVPAISFSCHLCWALWHLHLQARSCLGGDIIIRCQNFVSAAISCRNGNMRWYIDFDHWYNLFQAYPKKRECKFKSTAEGTHLVEKYCRRNKVMKNMKPQYASL